MITIDELKVQLAEYGKSVQDLEEALAIDASKKRVQELEHTMTRPGFYDDAEASKKVFDEVGDLKAKLGRFEKLQGLYEDAQTMLLMLEEENDPALVPEGEQAVEAVGKAVDELQLMTMLNGEYDHSNAILTFHAGTGGTEAQDWAEMLPDVHPLGRQPRHERGSAGLPGRRRGRHQERFHHGQGRQRLWPAQERERRPPPGAGQPLRLQRPAADQLCLAGGDARAGQHHRGQHP